MEKAHNPEEQGQAYNCVADGNTWSNQRKKRRELKRKLEVEQGPDVTEEKDEDNGCIDVSVETNPDVSRHLGDKSQEEESPCTTAACTGLDGTTTRSHSLCSFTVHIQNCGDGPAESVMLKMKWIDGNNKNDLYQLFQYFQNKIIKGLWLDNDHHNVHMFYWYSRNKFSGIT